MQIPTLIGLAACTISLYQLSGRKKLVHTPRASRDFQQLRLVAQFGFILILATLLLLKSVVMYRYRSSFEDISVFSTPLQLISLIPTSWLAYVEVYKTTKPSGSLLIYWLTFVLVHAVSVSSLTAQYNVSSSLDYVLLATVLICFLLEWLQPRRTRNNKRFTNPYDQADIFSRLTFSWMTPLMKKGFEHFLTNEDLPELPSMDRTDSCNSQFEVNWQRQILENPDHPSLGRALFNSFGTKFMLAGVFKAMQDMLSFTQPQLLRLLIKFANEYRESDGEVPLTRGIYIAVGMFLVASIQTTCLHQYFERAFATGMNVRTALTNAIFKKSLVLSGEARGTRTTGDTVNLMSIDTQRLQEVCPNGHMIWGGPFQIALCLVSLYELMGNSMWVGVLILLILIPINSYLASQQKKLQQAQMLDKDRRTRLTSELLAAIKSIKLYAWEDAFVSRLEHVRDNQELTGLKKIGVFMAGMSYVFNIAPFIVSCSTFATYVYVTKKPLTTDIMFPALTLFNMLGFPLAMFPMLISTLVESRVAVKRVTAYLLGEELQSNAVERLPRASQIGQESVAMRDATFVYAKKNATTGPFALHNVTFTARKGELSCVVGQVGSGKTSLLMSLLGNVHKVKGEVELAGNIAYVAQNPWIFNGSVRENILFGHKYDEELYQETINACALHDDLGIFPEGDSLIVGEKGLSLSGGQKARLSLARAVYARADVYLLDDPLSAVDEHVGQHIISNVLSKQGLLASKTVILATNSMPVLQHADHIAMMVKGEIVEQGPLENHTPRIAALLKEFGRKKQEEEPDTEQQLSGSSAVPSTVPSSTASLNEASESESGKDESPRQITLEGLGKRSRRGSTRRPSLVSLSSSVAPLEVRKEHVEKGKVAWSVYREYAKVCGVHRVILFTITLIGCNTAMVAGNVWLKRWAEANGKNGRNDNIVFYLSIYAALGVSSAILQVVQSLVVYVYININAARTLHGKMLKAVVRAPMSFFETTPLGRIINRFSSDVYRVDQQLIRVFYMLFTNIVRVMFTIILICYSTPSFLLMAVPMTAFYLYFQRYYLRTSRELKRLDSVSKSPIFAQFQETLDGIATVRAFDATQRFDHVNQSYLDTNNKAYFPAISSNRWLAVRIEFLGSLMIFAASGLAVLSLPSGRVSGGVIGLSLSYALQTTQSLNWIVRMTVEVETNIVSVERMMEYSRLPSEAPEIISDHRPAANWPQHGGIELVHYSTRFRPELPLVLKDINLKIYSGEKIGIVGRTGAGKSSLTLALFRLIEAASGHIDIDDITIGDIGLKDLRCHLSIIPQDSQLFEGTVRENLDPANRYTDEQLWHSLELSHLKEHISSMEGQLDGRITEGGNNLSSGQHQLLSLARALLTDSKILVLDEATAAVDVETDKLVQLVIRKEFKDRTILTIAHRLNTILDSDRVVVLSYGEVTEFDSPKVLMQDTKSQFHALCKRGGVL